MERLPMELRDEAIRNEYLQNHIEWFLKNHNGSIEKFKHSMKEMYGNKNDMQLPLF
jgi:site-specific DNA-methyltransferase (adenine-specific)